MIENVKKSAHHKECKVCKKLFRCDANSHKVTCSPECMLLHRENRKAKTNCRYCGKFFTFSKSSKRIYCSYKCHLDSGGAWRAGMAAIGARMRYGAKKDANHNDIVDALQKVGAYVIDMSHVGGGFPDLIVGFQSKTILMEIKNPKTAYGRRGLNKNQLKWKEQWLGGTYCVVDGVEAAIRAIQVAK
jgi:endogenous inhibitor of DNA gyrase (YacG/DUF329 family)